MSAHSHTRAMDIVLLSPPHMHPTIGPRRNNESHESRAYTHRTASACTHHIATTRRVVRASRRLLPVRPLFLFVMLHCHTSRLRGVVAAPNRLKLGMRECGVYIHTCTCGRCCLAHRRHIPSGIVAACKAIAHHVRSCEIVSQTISIRCDHHVLQQRQRVHEFFCSDSGGCVKAFARANACMRSVKP
jgi:hypothetical protein